MESGEHSSLHPNCHHQITYVQFNLKIYYTPTYEQRIYYTPTYGIMVNLILITSKKKKKKKKQGEKFLKIPP